MKIHVTKYDKKNLAFLSAAASDDEARPVLQAIHIDEKHAVAANGFVLHIIPGGISFSDDAIGNNIITVDRDEAEITPLDPAMQFPQYQELLPDPKHAAYSIVINPALLAKSLKHFDPHRQIVLKFYAPTRPYEIYGYTLAGDPAYALIMPAYIDNTVNRWSPRSGDDIEVFKMPQHGKNPYNPF